MKKIVKLLILTFSLIILIGAKFPKPSGFVNDFARILSPDLRNHLENITRELDRRTSAEIAIVTIPTLGENTIEGYAVDLFEEWGIGKKGKDNGLLILLAMKEREVRIEVGYGLEGIIPDGLAGQIIREKMVPYFKKGDYAVGILAAVATCGNLIASEAGIDLSSLGSFPKESYRIKKVSAGQAILGKLLYLLFFILIFGGRFFIFPLLFMGRGGFWGGGGGGFGGFGGFGGGLSGGGGASGSW